MAKLLLLLTLLSAVQSVVAGTLFFADFESFTGAGLRPGGGNGALDSNQWRVSGLATGDTGFGEHHVSGGAARGYSSGPVRSGGLYAFDIASSTVLGWQSTGTNLTPGSLFLQIPNTRQTSWQDLQLDFELWFRNDQPRSSSVGLYAGTPGLPGLRLLDFATPLAAIVNPAWQLETVRVPLDDLAVIPGAPLSFEWRLDDAGGSGSRDELAIDNLRLTRLNPATAVGDGINTALYFGFGLGLLLLRTRCTRAGATQVNNT